MWRNLLAIPVLLAFVVLVGLCADEQVGWLCLLAALLLGGVLGWLVLSSFARRDHRALETAWLARAERLETARGDLEEELAASGMVAAKALDELAKRSEHMVQLEEELAGLHGELAGRKERLSKLEGELVRTRGELAGCQERVVVLEGLVGGERDDLKQIRGIGPALEKLLNGIGVVSFRQIAAWDEADIAQAAARLGAFPGRIHRDRWIESAAEAHRKKYGERLRTGDV